MKAIKKLSLNSTIRSKPSQRIRSPLPKWVKLTAEWWITTNSVMNERARSNATMRPVIVVTSPAFRNMVSAPLIPASFFERVVNQLLDVHLHMQASGGGVLQHDKEHVLGAVDHKVGAGGTVPFDLAG